LRSDLRNSGRRHDILIPTRDNVEDDPEAQSMRSYAAQPRQAPDIGAETRQRRWWRIAFP
jgi:hypothetical protein